MNPCGAVSPRSHGRVFRCNRPEAHPGEHAEFVAATFARTAAWTGSTWIVEPPAPAAFAKKQGRKA